MQVVPHEQLVPFKSIDVTTLTQDQLDEILLQNEVMKQDARVIKTVVFKVADIIGALDENGQFTTDDYDGAKIMSVMVEQFGIKLPFQKKKPKPFDFLATCGLMDIVKKYKNI